MKVIKVLTFVVIDLALYIFLGLMMLNYEDFYVPSDGPYYSLQSMTTGEKLIWFAYIAWFILNGLIVLRMMYKLYRRYHPVHSLYALEFP